jgi:uncharacterized protein YndB with AHSA1/START domain
LAWDAFTKKEILDKWWAPKPWVSKTKHINFETAGRRFYAMCGPEGEEHWSTQDFTAIVPAKNFKFISAFTDKDENIKKDFPSSECNLHFSFAEGITTVSISIKHKTLGPLEQNLKMGFKEGFTMTLKDLSQLLTNLKR